MARGEWLKGDPQVGHVKGYKKCPCSHAYQDPANRDRLLYVKVVKCFLRSSSTSPISSRWVLGKEGEGGNAREMAASAGQRLGLPGAASNSDGGADAGEGDRGALHVAQAIRTLELKDTCAFCGKPGKALKRCSICKHVWYCGAECQNAAWKGHKKTCRPPLSTDDVRAKVLACDADDWREVLKWEGRMDEMMAGESGATCDLILLRFMAAHNSGALSTMSETLPNGSPHHSLSSIRLAEQRIVLLGKWQRFRDQGEVMCRLASNLRAAGRGQEASLCYQKARKVGEAHGFFSVECEACLGLGKEKMDEGCNEEGLDLLRNALAASRLSENEGFGTLELPVLRSLIDALFLTEAIDEVE